MKIFRTVLGFLEDNPKSMRLGVVSERVREDLGDLRYKTIADSNREMRGDMERLRGDFHKAIRKASENGKESRTK